MARKSPNDKLTRCSGTMTESQYLAWIRSALRSKWLRWPPRGECLRAARRDYKGEKKQQKYEYQCAICKEWFPAKMMEVDHFPHDAGSILSFDDIGEFCNNLYCEVDNLRAVDKICHKAYTLSQRAGITLEEAFMQKRVTEAMKDKKAADTIIKQAGYTAKNDKQRREALLEIFKGEQLVN